MNKEQSADDPSVDLIRVKNMLNSTILMSYPDVVIACTEHKVFWKHSEQLRQLLVKHDTIHGLFPAFSLITGNHNHLHHLACMVLLTQSVTVRKVVKLQLNYCSPRNC